MIFLNLLNYYQKNNALLLLCKFPISASANLPTNERSMKIDKSALKKHLYIVSYILLHV